MGLGIGLSPLGHQGPDALQGVVLRQQRTSCRLTPGFATPSPSLMERGKGGEALSQLFQHLFRALEDISILYAYDSYTVVVDGFVSCLVTFCLMLVYTAIQLNS